MLDGVWRLLEPLAVRVLQHTHASVEDVSSEAMLHAFFKAAEQIGPAAWVLEAGSKQVTTERVTDSRWMFPDVPRHQYVLSDIEAGDNVDVIADLHALPEEWAASFDIFIASAVFEHLERPWIAAQQIARILKPGGISLVTTHQTFPLHGYPSDYYRFSTGALSSIFVDAGLEVVGAEYDDRSLIIPPADVVPPNLCRAWNRSWPSYVTTRVFARKPA